MLGIFGTIGESMGMKGQDLTPSFQHWCHTTYHNTYNISEATQLPMNVDWVFVMAHVAVSMHDDSIGIHVASTRICKS